MIRKRLATGTLVFGLLAGAYVPIAAGTAGSAEAATRSVGYGARGSQVVYIQRLLGVRQTGFFGNETRAATIHLQRKYHLRVTGRVDTATALTMLKILKSRHRAAPPRRVSGPSLANRALHLAAAQRGKPYVWGAEGPDSFDCSGLVQWSFAAAGIRMPRVSQQQWFAGPHINYADARPGDLLFWHYDPTDRSNIDHVAIYAGNGMMLVAPHTGDYVKYVPVPLTNLAGVVRVDPAMAAQIG
jgi:cell wall-associated NlpC family hydrolase